MNYMAINSMILNTEKYFNDISARKKYSSKQKEEFILVFLGYYLVFGNSCLYPLSEAFENTDIHIFKIGNSTYMGEPLSEYINKKEPACIIPKSLLMKEGNVVNLKLDILYFESSLIEEMESLLHEFGHLLAYSFSEIKEQSNNRLSIKSGFSKLTQNKNSNYQQMESIAFDELITSTVARYAFNQLCNLEIAKIDSNSVRKNIQTLKKTRAKVRIFGGYPGLQSTFYELTSNPKFIKLIVKYYPKDIEMFTIEFEAYTKGEISMKKIKEIAEILNYCSTTKQKEEWKYFRNKTQEYIRVFTENTKYVEKKGYSYVKKK